MYEVNEKTNHRKDFPAFIRTLGFDIVEKEWVDSFVIDGEGFDINYKKIDETARNRWTRETAPRKDRCIEILNGYKSVVAKIKFNVEIDRDKLVKQIQSAIDKRNAVLQEREDAKKNEMRILTSMRDYYFGNAIISTYVESIIAHEGELLFDVKGATIVVDASTGLTKTFIPYENRDGIFKPSDITKWAGDKADTASRANRVCSALKGMKPVGKEFSECAKGAHHRYVRKNRIEEI